MKTVPSLTANCTFISPTTSSPRARATVCWRMSSTTRASRVWGGRAQAESPECTPASSMCSMMPAMKTSQPSARASTSTSMASLRYLSTSTGDCPETRTASAM